MPVVDGNMANAMNSFAAKGDQKIGAINLHNHPMWLHR